MPSRSSAELAVSRRQFRGMRAAAIVAVVLLLLALVLWAVGLVAGVNADCGPGPRGSEGGRLSSPTGLETKLSLWPPGQKCEYGAGGDRGDHVAQSLGWIEGAVLALAGLAGLMLLLGLFSLIRYRRRGGESENWGE